MAQGPRGMCHLLHSKMFYVEEARRVFRKNYSTPTDTFSPVEILRVVERGADLEAAERTGIWRTEVRALAQKGYPGEGEVVVFTQSGISLFPQRDFARLQRFMDRGVATDPLKMSRVFDQVYFTRQVAGISEASRQRMINTRWIKEEEIKAAAEIHYLQKHAQARRQGSEEAINKVIEEMGLPVAQMSPEQLEFLRKVAAPRAPFPPSFFSEPIQQIFWRLDPKARDRFLDALLERDQKFAPDDAGLEFRAQLPSFRVDLMIDLSKVPKTRYAPRSVQNLLTLRPGVGSLWLGRTLIREQFNRHRVIEHNGRPTLLGRVIPENDIYLISMFPILEPFALQVSRVFPVDASMVRLGKGTQVPSASFRIPNLPIEFDAHLLYRQPEQHPGLFFGEKFVPSDAFDVNISFIRTVDMTKHEWLNEKEELLDVLRREKSVYMRMGGHLDADFFVVKDTDHGIDLRAYDGESITMMGFLFYLAERFPSVKEVSDDL